MHASMLSQSQVDPEELDRLRQLRSFSEFWSTLHAGSKATCSVSSGSQAAAGALRIAFSRPTC